MNESAVRLEEQVISLFSEWETEICQGWILKKMGRYLLVYPLYGNCSQMNILDDIHKCEEISCQGSLNCMFRIVEYTNYYLSSVLADNGYRVEKCCVVGELYLLEKGSCLYESEMQKCRLFLKQGKGTETVEYVMAEHDITVGIKRQNLLFLPDGNLPDGTDLEEILQFGVENGITQILADIPGREELPEQYKRAGFSKAYLYRCYQKEEKSSKKQEEKSSRKNQED